MKTKVMYIFILFAMTTFLYSLDNVKLQGYWDKFNHSMDSLEKINILVFDIGKMYESETPDSAIVIYNKALEDLLVIQKTDSKTNKEVSLDSLRANIYHRLGITYRKKREYSTAKKYIELALEISKKLKDNKNIIKNLNQLGTIYYYQEDYFKAKDYFQKTIKIAENIDAKEDLANAYIAIGSLEMSLGQYSNSMEKYFKAINIYLELNDQNSLAICYNDLGIIFMKQKNFEKAIEFYKKSFEIKKNFDDEIPKAISLNNIAIAYKNLNQIDLAIKFYEEALTIFEQENDDKGISAICNNLGICYSQRGDFSQSYKNYLKSFEAKKKLNDRLGMAIVYNNLANLHLSILKQINPKNKSNSFHYQEAKRCAKLSYDIGSDLKSLPIVHDSAETLKNLFTYIGDFKNALFYANRYIDITDSLFSEDKTKAISEMASKFELEKKQLEISNLNKENILKKLELEKIKEVQKNQRFVLIFLMFGLIIILTFALVLSYLLHQMRAINMLLKKKNDEIKIQQDEINKRNNELREKNEKLDEVNATKDRFISILAHDLKNSFNIIITASELIKISANNKNYSNVSSLINSLNETALRTYGLFEELLEWAKVQQDKSAFNPVLADIVDVIKSSIDVVTPQAKEKSINIFYEFKEKYNLLIDASMIKTVVRNFLTNAIKFTDIGGKIYINIFSMDNMLFVSIKDTGKGMDKSTLNSLFKIAEITSSVGTNGEKGTGFGLILCKELIEKHKGKIFVESKLGEGSTFTFSIPIKN